VTDGAWHVQRSSEIDLVAPEALSAHARGVTRAALVGRQVGSVHIGLVLAAIEPESHIDTHLHSAEESFYVLEGSLRLTIDDHTYRLRADDSGLIPLGVPHAWSTGPGESARWLEATAPAPRLSGPPDTFFTSEPVRRYEPSTFSNLDSATPVFPFSGVALKMLVDGRLGAALHTMFMIESQPSAVVHPHDHPFEESYYLLEGEVEATANDERFVLGPGDVFWTGVGCVHSFLNTSGGPARWIETQSPQPPARHSFRFNRDWDYLAERLDGP
jgi:quercetin dioxygenase-like cupin family protein